MYVKELKCVECGKSYPSNQMRFKCGCSGPLDVVYDYEEIEKEVNWELFDKRIFSHHRYREFFPVVSWDNLISLGEGGTPLVKSRSLGEKLGLEELYFKMESLNPTGSFKDRGTSVELGKALDFKSKEVVVASTGNMGSSIAAYCAKAGVKANIIIPNKVPKEKLEQMKVHGAEIIKANGDYSKAARLAREKFESENIYLMGDYPYRGEGEKSIGFELMDQSSPDKIFLPIGNGTLMKGTWKGIKEMNKVGLTDYKPEMFGIQSENCSTVVEAFNNNSEIPVIENPDTIAGAIACGDPLDGEEALEALEESGGAGIEVSEDQIKKARKMLAEEEGILAEEAGAVSFAGLLETIQNKKEEKIRSGDTVVCVITGHGLKSLE